MLKRKKKTKDMVKYRFKTSNQQYDVVIEAENWIKAWEVYKRNVKK